MAAAISRHCTPPLYCRHYAAMTYASDRTQAPALRARLHFVAHATSRQWPGWPRLAFARAPADGRATRRAFMTVSISTLPRQSDDDAMIHERDIFDDYYFS